MGTLRHSDLLAKLHESGMHYMPALLFVTCSTFDLFWSLIIIGGVPDLRRKVPWSGGLMTD